MLATFSIGLVIRETVRVLIGGQYHLIDGPLPGAFELIGINFSIWRTVIIVVTALVMLGCCLFLTRSTFGLQIRGSLKNPALARASGVSTKRLYALTFAFGAALAGLAGALMVLLFVTALIFVKLRPQGLISQGRK